MSLKPGLYEIRKYRVRNANAAPEKRGVRYGPLRDAQSQRNELTSIAHGHKFRGDGITSRLTPTELRIRRANGAHILYRVHGPVTR